jgi:hypothetical protein
MLRFEPRSIHTARAQVAEAADTPALAAGQAGNFNETTVPYRHMNIK